MSFPENAYSRIYRVVLHRVDNLYSVRDVRNKVFKCRDEPNFMRGINDVTILNGKQDSMNEVRP